VLNYTRRLCPMHLSTVFKVLKEIIGMRFFDVLQVFMLSKAFQEAFSVLNLAVLELSCLFVGIPFPAAILKRRIENDLLLCLFLVPGKESR
jgi:hypothetical protein